ncbi:MULTISPECIES: MFS transporter [unclassified Streptomyces]|uniref:MFS transporter n=1 Tax=unclassified Streptomyces TaxID=2593676 RepID=UPI000DBA9EF5|nr:MULTISPECIES: MFS transporter [unclassified Streptomyces]MYT72940.1 MFS transporter [Streptomyces sp. SID8367]RAJ78916.1 putative MFS family arabinose efflux permease [Streptomyces sp. PsTaAH-137]
MSPRARWAGVLSLLVIVLISYVDRVNVSVLITDEAFTDHFGITGDRIAQGALSTVFLVGYGLAAFFLTPLYETRLGVRRGLFVSVALWSVMTLLSPYALGALTLTVLRALLGGAEGPLFSLKTMYVREHFAPHEAGRPNAVSSMGVSLGTAAGLPLITYLVYHFDWHTSFLALAALNAVIGLPLIALCVRGRGVAAAHRPGFGATLKGALAMPRLAPVLLIEIATLAYLWGSSAWLPSFLLQERHFSLGAMGLVSSLPFLMSLVSGFLGGLLLDRLPVRLLALPFVVGSAGTAVCVLVVAAAHSDVVVATGMVLAGGFWGLQGPAIPTLVQHCAPARLVGSAYGVVNGVGNLVSAFMPTLMGVAIAASGGHGFGAGFALLAGAQAITLVCGAWLLLRPVRSAPGSSVDGSRGERGQGIPVRS